MTWRWTGANRRTWREICCWVKLELNWGSDKLVKKQCLLNFNVAELVKSYGLKWKLRWVKINRGVQMFKAQAQRPIHCCWGFRFGSEMRLVSASGEWTRQELTWHHNSFLMLAIIQYCMFQGNTNLLLQYIQHYEFWYGRKIIRHAWKVFALTVHKRMYVCHE